MNLVMEAARASTEEENLEVRLPIWMCMRIGGVGRAQAHMCPEEALTCRLAMSSGSMALHAAAGQQM